MRDTQKENAYIWNRFDDTTKWCIHYIVDHGVDNTVLWRIMEYARQEPRVSFTLVPEEGSDFYTTLAKSMIELWPAGSRTIDGKEYPWRDTVSNTRKRLETVFKLRKLDKFNQDDVLEACRRYLSRYENDSKYMKSLKYFILQHDRREGIKQVHSTLADMLENKVVEDISASWESVFDESMTQGTIV